MTLEERILQIFQKTQKQFGVSEIAREIGTERGVVHYHLKKLTERGTLQSSDGKYSLTDMSEKIENIIDLLSKKDCNILEIQTRGYDKDHIINLLHLLQSKGLVHIEMSKGYGTGEYHDRETKYSLTPLAYSEKGLCPICKKKIDSSGNIIIATRKGFSISDWANVSIHARCYTDSGDVPKKDVICDYCGLPISPKRLLENRIRYRDIYNNFYDIEINTIDFLKNLILELNQYTINQQSPKKAEDYIIINNSIKKIYNSFYAKMCNINQIPEWIVKGMELDEKPEIDTRSELDKISKKLQNSDVYKEYLLGMEKLKENTIGTELYISSIKSIEEKYKNSDSFKEYDFEMNRIKKIIEEQSQLISRTPTYSIIFKDINNKFVHCDLSNLNESEAFFYFIKKYHNNLPEDYDIKSRIKDVWSAALKQKQERKNNILRMYEKLLQPSGFVYTNIEPEWPFDPREKEYIKEAGSGKSNFFHKNFESYQFMAFKNCDKLYHPFCAEKLGLKDDSYCNNINSKGGDNNEQKIRND